MKRKIIAVAAVLPGVLTGCSSGNDDQQGAAAQSAGAQAPSARFAVILHGSAGDAFWNGVKNGVGAVGRQYGVTVNYQSDSEPAKQSQLIDQAVSEKVDGLVVAVADPEALKEPIAKAVAAKIPLITINSGRTGQRSSARSSTSASRRRSPARGRARSSRRPA